MNIYLIVGDCGTGKTWVMKSLISRFSLNQKEKIGLYSFVHDDKKIAVLGVYDGSTFEGSDRLSMGIMADNEKVKDVLNSYSFVIAEGDRFTNSKFVSFFKPKILKICGDGSDGRKKRGSSQSQRQLKSISTRVKNIPENFTFSNSDRCFDFLCKEIEKFNTKDDK